MWVESEMGALTDDAEPTAVPQQKLPQFISARAPRDMVQSFNRGYLQGRTLLGVHWPDMQFRSHLKKRKIKGVAQTWNGIDGVLIPPAFGKAEGCTELEAVNQEGVQMFQEMFRQANGGQDVATVYKAMAKQATAVQTVVKKRACKGEGAPRAIKLSRAGYKAEDEEDE